MKFAASVVLTLMMTSFALGQNYYDGPNKRERKALAYEQIKALKNGVLLVRLGAESAKVDALVAAGKMNEAKIIMAELHARNAEIMQAFSTKYKYSKVYFFYSYDAPKVLDGNFEGALFDAAKHPVLLNKETAGTLFILTSDKAEMQNTGGDLIGFSIYTFEMKPLLKPFPYNITKNVGSAAFEKSYEEMVVVWQAKLFMLEAKSENKKISKREAMGM